MHYPFTCIITLKINIIHMFTGLDYILQESSVTLTPTATEYTVTIQIVDNDISEPETEAVGLTFTEITSADETTVTFSPSTITIYIVDDDGRSLHNV